MNRCNGRGDFGGGGSGGDYGGLPVVSVAVWIAVLEIERLLSVR